MRDRCHIQAFIRNGSFESIQKEIKQQILLLQRFVKNLSMLIDAVKKEKKILKMGITERTKDRCNGDYTDEKNETDFHEGRGK